MKLDEWMSSFYGKNWYRLEENSPTIKFEDNSLFEWRVEVQNHSRIQEAQQLGFELVESFIEFKSDIYPIDQKSDKVLLAESSDIEEILNITQICMGDNDNLYTRFKNKKYFSYEQCNRYYQLSIENNFNDKNVITVVAKDRLGICGYYMLKKANERVYKGLMTGVLPRARGQKLHLEMQFACFSLIESYFSVINTTQLNNFFTINNHIKENRKLSKIEHIFFKLT